MLLLPRKRRRWIPKHKHNHKHKPTEYAPRPLLTTEHHCKAQKKQTQKERKKVRNACADLTEKDADLGRSVETLCAELSLEELRDLNESLGKLGSGDERCAEVGRSLGALKERQAKMERERAAAAKLAADEAAAREAAEEARNARPWSDEEMGLLQKGVKKFPQGTPVRWKKISEFIGGNHSEKAVITKARELQHDVSSDTKFVKDGAAFERAMAQRQQTMSSKAQEAAAQEVEQKKATELAKKKRPIATESIPKKGASAKEADKASETKEAVVSEWSPDQQKQLEKALKTYDSKDPDRWVKIAGDVPGKTKKECVARYKEIVALLKAKKAAAAAQ